MNKFQTFVTEHEREIKIAIVASSIGLSIGLAIATKRVNGQQLVAADLYERAEDGVKFLHVKLANGSIRDYLWTDAPTSQV